MDPVVRHVLTLLLSLFGLFACTAGSAPEPQPEGATTQTVEAVELPVGEQPDRGRAEGSFVATGPDDPGRAGGGDGVDTNSLGNTGLIGEDGGGDRLTYGRLGSQMDFGPRGERQSQILLLKPRITGEFDRLIFRQTVRAHQNEVRSCYDAGRTKDPTLRGKVVIELVIGANGKVSSAKVNESLANDPAVGTCIAKTITHWTFPKPPDGGDVTVVCPFGLSPG